MDVVRRNYMLITPGSQRLKQGAKELIKHKRQE